MNDPLESDGHDAPIFAPDAFRLTAFQSELINKARRFGRRVLAPRAAHSDRAEIFPSEHFRYMHWVGLRAICILK
jgi:hypothetical protein